MPYYLKIVIHFNDLTRSFSFDTFYIAIDHLVHGDGVVPRKICFIMVDSILHEAGRDHIDSDRAYFDLSRDTGASWKKYSDENNYSIDNSIIIDII